jgi:hypothetical protein
MQRKVFIAAILIAAAFAAPASSACYADYKAKQESPLRLHYGVLQLDVTPCRMSGTVTSLVKDRIAAGGWKLLQVQSVFDESGLEDRKRDAGQFFLRF